MGIRALRSAWRTMSGAPLTEAEIASYKTYVLVELALMEGRT